MENHHVSRDPTLDFPSSYANPPSILSLPQQQQRHPLNRTEVNVSNFHTAGVSEREDDMELLDDLHFYQGPASKCLQPLCSEHLSEQLFQQDATRLCNEGSISFNHQLYTAPQMDYLIRHNTPAIAALDLSAHMMRQADAAATESRPHNSGGPVDSSPYYRSGGEWDPDFSI